MVRTICLGFALLFAVLGAAVLVLYFTAPVDHPPAGVPRPLPGLLGMRWAAPEWLLGVYILWVLGAYTAFLAARRLLQLRRPSRPVRFPFWRSLVFGATIGVCAVLLLTVGELRLRHPQLSFAGVATVLAAVCFAVWLTYWVSYRLIIEYAIRQQSTAPTVDA